MHVNSTGQREPTYSRGEAGGSGAGLQKTQSYIRMRRNDSAYSSVRNSHHPLGDLQVRSWRSSSISHPFYRPCHRSSSGRLSPTRVFVKSVDYSKISYHRTTANLSSEGMDGLISGYITRVSPFSPSQLPLLPLPLPWSPHGDFYPPTRSTTRTLRV